jgi:hypothetical protein
MAMQQTRQVTAPCPSCGLYHAPNAACPVAAPLAARVGGRALAPGAILGGRFRVDAVTHRSGMSTIYRATDLREQLGTVAVKQVSVAGLSDEEQQESRSWLAREAGLLSSLKNPHLPELLAAFSEGDEHFVVMPFLEGRTVKELVVSEGPLREDYVVRWACILADVLAYLHSQDPPIIHRDLKPDNILILPDMKLMLLDLGVARPMQRGVAGTAIGTPGYAPPEQYHGLADERSDLYALGATVHYMLTGYDAEHEPPFRQPPVRELEPDVSPQLEQLVGTLLQVVPERRPQDAAAVSKQFALVDLVALGVASGLYRRALRSYLIAGACLSGFLCFVALPSFAGMSTIWALLPWITFAATAFARRPERRREVEVTKVENAVIQMHVQRVEWMLLPATFAFLFAFGFIPGSQYLALLVGLLTIALLLVGWKTADRTVQQEILSLNRVTTTAAPRLRP